MDSPTERTTLPLGPNANYQVKDVVIHRKYKGQFDESLVKWTRIDNKGQEERDPEENACKYYLIWMRKGEMEACCPHLLSLGAKAPPGSAEVGGTGAEEQSALQKTGEIEGDDSFRDMVEDINTLVGRAERMRQRKGQKRGGVGSKMLSNTISILSAYARIGTLANTFRESGALDLLLSLLSSYDLEVRHSASDMLRSLATFDSASRAYVLLQLTRSDEAESAAKSTAQSRQMLLDLFAETASSEESELLLSGISLPQVPGRFIFSLLKKYLRVTSLTRNDTMSTPLPEVNSNLEEDVAEASQFELFYTTYQLITELFAVFNWSEGTLDEGVQQGTNRQLRGVSIFTGTKPTEEVTLTVKKKKKNPYKLRDDFMSDRDYGQYVKATLNPGMRVRARVNYESVSGGDYGVYKQTNDGTPPAQFTWDGLGGDTYWVYWHQVEIIPPASETSTEVADPIGAAFKKPVKQPYVMKSLAVGSEGERSHEPVDQLFWWEVLSIMKPLPPNHTDDIIALLKDPRLKTFDDLIHMTPSFAEVAEVTQYLESAFPFLVHEPLSVKELGQFRAVYKEDSFQQVIGSLKVEDPSVDDIEGPYKKEPPYPDLFFTEDPVRVPILPDDIPGLEDAPLTLIRTLMRHRREEVDPEMHLRSMGHLHDGSLKQILATKELVEKYLDKYPDSCRTATHCLMALKSGVDSLTSESDRCECCVTGFFTLFLKLMHVNRESCSLQCIGLECFFKLMGGFGIHDSLPNPGNSGVKGGPLSDSTKSLIITTLLSLASATEYGGLKAVVDALRCIVDYYNLKMNALVRKNAIMGVRGGLCVLATVLTDPDTQQKTDGWGIPAVLDSMQRIFPDFASKNEFCTRIAMAVPGYTELPENSDVSPENATLDTGSPRVKTITREIMIVIKLLRNSDDIYSKNPLPRLLKLMERDITVTNPFMTPRNAFPALFLLHEGVFYLTQAMVANRSSTFTENALILMGSLVLVGEEEAAQVVLQGGLKAIINCMNVFPGNKQIQKLCLLVLQALAKDPDHVVIMVSEDIASPLRNVKDKYASDDELYCMASRLQEKCESDEMSRARLNQKILGIIFSGVLQLILSGIEDARRSRTLVNVPKFSAFIKYISAGTGGGVNLGEKDQCFDRVECSSNSHRKDRMLDNDLTTYWESSGRAGTHWVRLYMRPGLVIRKLTMDVSSSDSSFMPQRVTIQGGNTPDNVQDVSTVYIPTGFTGAYELITNAKKHYPVIVIRIKRCQQVGGIDARIRGLNCQAALPSLWPIFGDLFSARTKLFYHIQVKTWLRDHALGPLQLFDRLSGVILHEQTFADNFLVTPTSRHCLGQACRSALITPLISTLTKTGAVESQSHQEGPNFHALIHEYITHMPIPAISQFPWRSLTTANEHDRDTDLNPMPGDPFGSSRSQYQLVQMSRIRRMCRLLVDCDNSKITKPTKQSIEDEAEDVLGQSTPVPIVTTGAGTIEMAKCWLRIVHSEVIQMLKRFDYTDSPHAITADLLTLYTQLKQAMMELFGGHSQFALALKKGFSKAFQSLDEVTGVRFCELLCLCIDSLMDTAGKDTTRFQHIGEHQREAMLLHFAEPLQFLHNLDVAHVFEHYYRRHLSARLLRGRSLSLPLEKRLVQVFAHCFPHKYPLQMLQDLDDSMLVMDRFLDSELLESLDQLMVHAGTQQLAPEVMELAQKCSFYRQRILHVYTLNPCFWPLRQRPMPPLSTLPSPLSTFCEDYQRYFTAVHVFGLRRHEKARRLYWTLHGWASVGHSGTKLLVSTVQMIVLLQFNNGELHSLRSLQEATRLSYHELCDALLALSAERQCILMASQPSSQEAPMAVDDDPYLQTTPFRTSTTFRVNSAFPSDIAKKQKSNKVRFHEVRLINKSHGNLPSREERTLDLAHVFERRRAIMDSAIIRILKREREMSMDNIAVKVIAGCSAGKFDKGASFGKFDCDFRDVCARVDRLIVDGYIKRDATNQQMLNYIPDRSTEKTEEEGEQPESTAEPVATEEKPVEPSPAEKNDKDTPTEKATPTENHTHDVAPPTSSPTIPSTTTTTTTTKLLPRKRSNMSRPTLGKMKRKQQFTRLYSNEMYERDEAPLLGMLPTSRSLTVEEVQQQINSVLEAISQILLADTHMLESLLYHCQWNKDTLIQRYLNDSASLLQEAGLDGSPSQSSPPSDPVSCPVCLLSVPLAETVSLWCGHACCKTCWRQHLSAQLDLNQALVCSCPIGGCHARPTRTFFIELFGTESDTVGKYIKAVVRSYVERSGRLTWCQNPQGCDQVLCRGDGMDTGTCLKCHWSSCFSCHFSEAHQPVSCEDMTKWVEAGGFYEGMDEDARSKQLANLIAKKCPGCNAHIEKNEGCLHMKCKCGYDFCWKCLRSWRPSHTDFYECFAKVSKAAADQKKFVDYNQRVTSQQKSKMFAEKLCVLVRGIGESVPMKTLSFVSDACDLLVQCHKMLSYASVSEYYSQPDDSVYLGFLSQDLEGDTNALQAFLENTLLSTSDVVQALHTFPERNLLDGYRLVNRIESTRDKLLLGFHQRFKLGEAPSLNVVAEEPEPKSSKLSPSLLSSPNDDEDRFTDEDEEEFEDDDFEDDDLSYVYSDYDSLPSMYDDPYDSDMFPF